jgi:transposase
MIINIQNLPSETSALHQIIHALDSERSAFEAERNSFIKRTKFLEEKDEAQTQEILKLKEQLRLLKMQRFGKSSEKMSKGKNEALQDEIENLELRIKTVESNNSFFEDKEELKGKARRQKLSPTLPREDIILNPEPECPSCGGEEFEKISDDISETLEYIPARFKVIRHIRPRCKCIQCSQIIQAYAPSKPIDKGNAGAGLLAHVLVNKYCDHLPLYRQNQIFEREDIQLSTSTLCDWISSCAILLAPLAQKIKDHIFSAEQIHGDDTIVKVLNPGMGKTKTGRIWTYVSDGRPHGDKTPPAACYFYSPDRKSVHPEEHLENYKGVMHADAYAYAGYNGLYIGGKNEGASIEEAACWAHTRRKFYEVTVASNNAVIAVETINQIQKIYKIEEGIRGSPAEIRKKMRQETSKNLVLDLFAFWKKAYSQLPKKSRTAQAIKYAFNNEEALKRFLDNGQIEIDNNAAERALRSVAIGRKNWVFAGSDKGGDSAAIIFTIIETAKLNKVNPWKYLQKVLDIIQDYNSNKLEDLLPWNLTLEKLENL